jgi:hypothetical protein
MSFHWVSQSNNIRVPIYSISSWLSLVSLKAAFWVDPIRDVYEVRSSF